MEELERRCVTKNRVARYGLLHNDPGRLEVAPARSNRGLGAERVPWYVTLLNALDLEDELFRLVTAR